MEHTKQSLLEKHTWDHHDLVELLSSTDTSLWEKLQERAYQVTSEHCGNKVYYRGLIEFSNICSRNCLYCGIRTDNKSITRYQLSEEEICDAARWCAQSGYGSLVLQSGERSDPAFIDFVERIVKKIKAETRSEKLPAGLGVTLCVGEQSRETYQRFFDAGAHRYLLRIETTNPTLFSGIHPPEQTLETRTECLNRLKDVGFQVGTGVMIGLPGQTVDMLADDLEFFRAMDIDMFGMGPYIHHEHTPLNQPDPQEWTDQKAFDMTLRMLCLTRLMLKDVNIAATTALQALDPVGREKGILHGANVIMPQLTPTVYRKEYMLYDNKPCIDEQRGDCKRCLETRIPGTQREVARDEWGDSSHYFSRTSKKK